MRVLLLADTHIGYDLALRPRTDRLRRGPDFVANFARALEPARSGEVDLVVHGGDLFHRSRPPPAVIDLAWAPLIEVAELGVPVLVIPGNHERSKLPRTLLTALPHLHVFDEPKTIGFAVRGVRVVVTGMPFARDAARSFPALLRRAEASVSSHERASNRSNELQRDSRRTQIRLLCLHQAVEGATVGPSDYVFRRGPDVIPANAIPVGYAAVLAGHIHRRQVLRRAPDGRRLAAPILYPGSVERTSSAERDEPKGYMVIDMEAGSDDGGRISAVRFRSLPTRNVNWEFAVRDRRRPR